MGGSVLTALGPTSSPPAPLSGPTRRGGPGQRTEPGEAVLRRVGTARGRVCVDSPLLRLYYTCQMKNHWTESCQLTVYLPKRLSPLLPSVFLHRRTKTFQFEKQEEENLIRYSLRKIKKLGQKFLRNWKNMDLFACRLKRLYIYFCKKKVKTKRRKNYAWSLSFVYRRSFSEMKPFVFLFHIYEKRRIFHLKKCAYDKGQNCANKWHCKYVFLPHANRFFCKSANQKLILQKTQKMES